MWVKCRPLRLRGFWCRSSGPLRPLRLPPCPPTPLPGRIDECAETGSSRWCKDGVVLVTEGGFVFRRPLPPPLPLRRPATSSRPPDPHDSPVTGLFGPGWGSQVPGSRVQCIGVCTVRRSRRQREDILPNRSRLLLESSPSLEARSSPVGPDPTLRSGQVPHRVSPSQGGGKFWIADFLPSRSP